MSRQRKPVNRRRFIQTGGLALTGALTSATFWGSGCSRPPSPGNEVTLGTTGYAAESFRKILHDLDFTGQTGLKVNVIVRPTSTNELLTQMAGAIQAGTSPYDILDFEDAVAISLSRAGWLLPLNDLITEEIWNDFTEPLQEMSVQWDRFRGETIRIHHNFELCYWWYRKDWFEKQGLEAPATWDQIRAMGNVFTDKNKGVWATEEALQKNTFLNVYMAWITRQAGGNLYAADESFEMALAYIHDLMYAHQALNPACLQKNYDQQNNDYLADRVAFMRQWPFFYDVARQYSSWYAPDKVACALPPVGPGGKSVSTYAAGWGYGIPKTAPNAAGAKELIRFLIASENAAKFVSYSSWFLNARHSVLEAAEDKKLARFLKMYMNAGVIATRPFHEKYTEAVTILENIVSAFLTRQLSRDEAVRKAREQMRKLDHAEKA